MFVFAFVCYSGFYSFFAVSDFIEMVTHHSGTEVCSKSGQCLTRDCPCLLFMQWSSLRPERSVYSSGQGDKREGQRPRVSGIQADLARGERATRRSVLEAELAQLQHSFHQRLAGNRSAGQAILDPSLRAAAVSPSTVEGDVSPPDTDSAQVDVTPRQRVWEAERRWEKRVDALARQELAVVRIQAMVRGFRARAKTRSRLATQRDVRTHFSALTARAHRIQ